jgi:hypothetical protein
MSEAKPPGSGSSGLGDKNEGTLGTNSNLVCVRMFDMYRNTHNYSLVANDEKVVFVSRPSMQESNQSSHERRIERLMQRFGAPTDADGWIRLALHNTGSFYTGQVQIPVGISTVEQLIAMEAEELGSLPDPLGSFAGFPVTRKASNLGSKSTAPDLAGRAADKQLADDPEFNEWAHGKTDFLPEDSEKRFIQEMIDAAGTRDLNPWLDDWLAGREIPEGAFDGLVLHRPIENSQVDEAEQPRNESIETINDLLKVKPLTPEEILSEGFPHNFNPYDLIATLDEPAKRRIIESGIVVRSLVDDDYVYGVDDLFHVVWTEHPDGHEGHDAEFYCPRCKTVIMGRHDEFGQIRDFYAADNMDMQGTPICSNCVLEYLQPEHLQGLSPNASLLLLKELESLRNSTKAAAELKNNQSEAPDLATSVKRRCGFGEDEDVHAHALISTAKPRFSHATAFDFFGAWLLTSDKTAAIMAPLANVPSGETDQGYLQELALDLRAKAREFMDCGDWVELLEEIAKGSLTIDDEPEVFIMTSMSRVISDHSDFDSPTYPEQPSQWIQT